LLLFDTGSITTDSDDETSEMDDQVHKDNSGSSSGAVVEPQTDRTESKFKKSARATETPGGGVVIDVVASNISKQTDSVVHTDKAANEQSVTDRPIGSNLQREQSYEGHGSVGLYDRGHLTEGEEQRPVDHFIGRARVVSIPTGGEIVEEELDEGETADTGISILNLYTYIYISLYIKWKGDVCNWFRAQT